MATTTPRPWVQAARCFFGVAAAAVTLAGCVQSTANNAPAIQPGPVTAPVATTDPVMLSGANLVQEPMSATASASPVGSSAPTAQSDIAEPVQPLDPVVASPAPAPDAVTPAPIPVTPPVVAETTVTPPVEPAPQAAPAPPPVASAATPNGYPNINVQPPQPDGKLLSPEERAKLIAELNALANRNNQ